MNRLSIISDSVYRAKHINSQLAGVFETQFLSLDDIPGSEPTLFTVGDVNLDQRFGREEFEKIVAVLARRHRLGRRADPRQQRNGKIVEMKCLLMTFENSGDGTQQTVAFLQNRPGRNGQMFPGNER